MSIEEDLSGPNTQAVRPNNDPAWNHSLVAMNDAEVEAFDECMEEVKGFGEELVKGEQESDDDDDDKSRVECQEDQAAPERDDDAKRDPGPEPALGEEEVCPPQVATQPRLPSRDEIDVHEAMGHAQFRNWC